jgi:hypothetical protein
MAAAPRLGDIAEPLLAVAQRRRALANGALERGIHLAQAGDDLDPAAIGHVEGRDHLRQEFLGARETARDIGIRRRFGDEAGHHMVVSRDEIEQALAVGQRRLAEIERADQPLLAAVVLTIDIVGERPLIARLELGEAVSHGRDRAACAVPQRPTGITR